MKNNMPLPDSFAFSSSCSFSLDTPLFNSSPMVKRGRARSTPSSRSGGSVQSTSGWSLSSAHQHEVEHQEESTVCRRIIWDRFEWEATNTPAVESIKCDFIKRAPYRFDKGTLTTVLRLFQCGTLCPCSVFLPSLHWGPHGSFAYVTYWSALLFKPRSSLGPCQEL